MTLGLILQRKMNTCQAIEAGGERGGKRMNNSDHDFPSPLLAEMRSLGHCSLGQAARPQEDFSWMFSFEGLDSVKETGNFSPNSYEDFHSDG